MDKLTFGSLFAGIGGFDLGLERAGMVCKWQVEIDDYATKILEKHWPTVARFRDVRDCGKANLKSVDLVCGGFPCQDVSLAGKRAGLDGKRSTLWSEFYRIICEIRPGWVIIENVPGLYSSNDGRFFAKILRELAESGYDAEWDCIPAIAVGAPHKRDRVFIIAYAEGGYAERARGRCYTGRAHHSQVGRGLWLEPESKSAIWIMEGWAQRTRRTYTDVLRVANGISDRSHRLRALGNAVVPQVAEWIGRQIIAARNGG